MKKVIMVSGGFDPPHIGHTRMFTEAAEWGEVVVALNSDEWLMRKKGYVFMPWAERAELIQQFESVGRVVAFNDEDNTACDALRLSLIHISEPTRPLYISYAVFCLKKKITSTVSK